MKSFIEIFIRCLVSATIIVSIFGCEKEHNGCKLPPEPEPLPEPVDVYPVAGDGWDIYSGPNYRYGPSIIINEDSSIDIWLAAPGDYHGKNQNTYIADSQEASQLGIENSFAQRFTMAEPFGFISLQCPSWGSTSEGFTVDMYEWDTDYQTTIRKNPLVSKKFTNYTDNAWLSIYKTSNEDYTETFPSGTYLWVMRGGTEKSGIWKSANSKSPAGIDALSFVNGTPTNGQWHCRITSDGSGNYFWDKVVWRHSTDGGKTWTDEADALLPSDGKRDAFSICDPGVAKWGGYYYIAYTSTEEPNGYDNDVYVARSANPNGPWEKWSGSGWGDDPQPVIDYHPLVGHEGVVFGAGEPCIVVKDDVVYFYYSWNDYLIDENKQGTTTRVSVASALDSDWPAHLEYKGVALDKSDISKPDHTDVKYVERSQKFIAIHAERRDTDYSRIRVWESEDGITFIKGDTVQGTLCKGIINAGMSGDAFGHVKYGEQQYLCYAHSDAPREWGRWFTWFQPLDWVDME